MTGPFAVVAESKEANCGFRAGLKRGTSHRRQHLQDRAGRGTPPSSTGGSRAAASTVLLAPLWWNVDFVVMARQSQRRNCLIFLNTLQGRGAALTVSQDKVDGFVGPWGRGHRPLRAIVVRNGGGCGAPVAAHGIDNMQGLWPGPLCGGSPSKWRNPPGTAHWMLPWDTRQ